MRNTRQWIIVLANLLLLWACASQAVQPPGSKPQSPVEIKITPTQQPQAGQDIEFTVTTTVKISAAQLHINIQTPADMTLTNGSLSWQGPLDRGETKILRFTGRFSARVNQRIVATAAIKSSLGARFASRMQYLVNPTAVESQSQKAQGKNTQRNGRSVVEYALPK